jgi:eukaryotic-like serine/threonine-protein kinase
VTLATGSKLGPYEISAAIGAGGMGEVYRAKDTRLDRDVAIKVLPEGLFGDQDLVARFAREAKALAALNHPGIAAVHSFEEVSGRHLLVQELLEGETLRQALAAGKLPIRRAVEWAIQIAQALSAAHEKGIVHRDLKPENLFVTKEGRVKILDFGLAKLTNETPEGSGSNLPTAARGTEPGVVLGTMGYMAPEQVRGYPATPRTDLFAFGAVLYEMLAGKRAFAGDSGADVISAILREDPPDLSVTNHDVPPALERIVRRCLEKVPERRFQSAGDLAFALESAGTGSEMRSGAAATAPREPERRARVRAAPLAAGLVLLLAGAGAGFVARGFRGAPEPPSFKRMSFRRGTVWTARFAPDGQTIVYGSAWDGNPMEVFLSRPESPESRSLGLQNASLFGVSPTGELAVMLDARTAVHDYERSGTLARVPLVGGSPRPLLENVRYADWSPDGRELMVERVVDGKHRIEYPIGKVIYESSAALETPRVSPSGDAVAFFEAADVQTIWVRVVERGGKVRTLTVVKDWWNLAWSADGKEVLYAAPEAHAVQASTSLLAVSLAGETRLLLRFPGTLELHDVARDGRVLLASLQLRYQVVASSGDGKVQRELSWLDGALLADLSADGKTVLLNEHHEGGGPNGSIYLRGSDGAPATLIGEGTALSLSPDGRHVFASVPGAPQTLFLLPTGTGTPRKLELQGISGAEAGVFFPDGKSLLVVDSDPGELPRTYVVPIEGGKPRPLGPPGVSLLPRSAGDPIAPDGRAVALIGSDRRSVLCAVDTGALTPIAGMAPGEFAIRWTADGRFLYIRGGDFPAKVWKLELATGRRELLREIAPSDLAGVTSIVSVLMTPDAKTLVYAYRQNLSDLYVVSGLK